MINITLPDAEVDTSNVLTELARFFAITAENAKMCPMFSSYVDLQREVFAAGVEHMELLRGQHRSRPSSDAVLLCDNLTIRWIDVQDATAHRRVLAWPHWMPLLTSPTSLTSP